jgi:hypothetical protein
MKFIVSLYIDTTTNHFIHFMSLLFSNNSKETSIQYPNISNNSDSSSKLFLTEIQDRIFKSRAVEILSHNSTQNSSGNLEESSFLNDVIIPATRSISKDKMTYKENLNESETPKEEALRVFSGLSFNQKRFVINYFTGDIFYKGDYEVCKEYGVNIYEKLGADLHVLVAIFKNLEAEEKNVSKEGKLPIRDVLIKLAQNQNL